MTILSPRTTRELTPEVLKNQVEMYGQTEAEMCADLEFLVKMNMHVGSNDKAMNLAAMSILSDAQEAIAHGSNEMARQFINKSKWLITYNQR